MRKTQVMDLSNSSEKANKAIRKDPTNKCKNSHNKQLKENMSSKQILIQMPSPTCPLTQLFKKQRITKHTVGQQLRKQAVCHLLKVTQLEMRAHTAFQVCEPIRQFFVYHSISPRFALFDSSVLAV